MPRLCLVLLLILTGAAFGISARAASDFWSIDCGGTEAFTDENGLAWRNDSLLAPPGGNRFSVAHGTRVAWLPTGEISLPRELSTLRAFPSKATRRHCYTIPGIGSGRRILLRTTFFYGNYDGKSNPPRFSMIWETEYWSLIPATMSNVTMLEAIYTTTRNDTRVCLCRDYPEQDPFINTIEIRALPPEMYAAANSSAKLWTLRRNAFGAKAIIRYPDDGYDRMWRPVRSAESQTYQPVPNTAPGVDVSSAGGDDPPQRVFETVVQPLPTIVNGVLNISTPNLPSASIPIYLNLYFTEPLDLAGTEKVRAFNLFQNGRLLSSASQTIIPPYGQVLELVYDKPSASSATVFSLVPADGTNLPPVISALELFWVTYELTATTDIRDVGVLSKLQGRFPVLQEWTGDPCLPDNYAWDWLGCSSATSPRVTNLSLAGFRLSGDIPDFSSLDELTTIDLHNNKFTGAVPEFLANFPNLEFLNLAANNFTSIPASWSRRTSAVMLNVTGNPGLCGPGDICVSALDSIHLPTGLPPPPGPTTRNGMDDIGTQPLLLLLALVMGVVLTWAA